MEEELLVELVARGIPEICLVDGDCRTCKYRGAVPAIDDTVESTRTLIEAMGSDAQITRTSEFPASVQVEDMRKAVGAARREFFTSSGHYAKDVAKSAAEKVVNDKLTQLHLQKQEQSLREKLGVKNGAGKMPTIEAERNIAILDAMSRIGDPDEPVVAAARLMRQRSIGALPVCEDDGTLAGMLTDRDIVVRCVSAGDDPQTCLLYTSAAADEL